MRTKTTPNPKGREGKPISLSPHSFDDALRKILSASPPPKHEKPKEKKRNKKRR